MAPSPCLPILLISCGLLEATSEAIEAVYLSPEAAPVHSERLGGGALYLWQLDYDAATLAVEVQIAPRDNKHHAGTAEVCYSDTLGNGQKVSL